MVIKMEEEDQHQETEEDILQQLRSKATELLLREEWKESIQLYSHFISLCQKQLSNPISSNPDQLTKLQKSTCLAFSNRAEARLRLRDFTSAIVDCDEALKLETAHFKTLLCKGRILLCLDQYSNALKCFKLALSEIQNNGNLNSNSESLNGYLEMCKKLEYQSRTGAFDLSDWVLNRFQGKSPLLGEFIGSVQIKKCEVSGRGMFATKNMESGTLLFVTKAIATGRGILPDPNEDLGESARQVMWKDFVDRVVDCVTKCRKTQRLFSTLSTGEDEERLEVPDINIFKPEYTVEEQEMSKIMNNLDILDILDVNSLTEDAVSAKVFGKNSDYYGVGLWILASFINHSCNPNARRIHVGDHVLVHTSRDVKAGEEITFAYFDVLMGLKKRREMCKTWGFCCNCRRCRFEEVFGCREEVKEIELSVEFGVDNGSTVFRLEEGMRKWNLKGKEKGYLRASFWGVYCAVFVSEKVMRKWGRRIPGVEVVGESVIEVVGGDERVVKMVVRNKGSGGGGGGVVQMEKMVKLGRSVYGKMMKKQATRALLELCATRE